LNEYGIIANVCPNTRNAEHKENYFFEEELYKELFVIERTNAWMDGFRSFSLDLIQQFPIGRAGVMELSRIRSDMA